VLDRIEPQAQSSLGLAHCPRAMPKNNSLAVAKAPFDLNARAAVSHSAQRSMLSKRKPLDRLGVNMKMDRVLVEYE
jgi:hypothetical protein